VKTWVVQIEATFSDTVEVEADSYDEAFWAGQRKFEDEYQVVSQWGLPWDSIEAVEVNEMED
jgi:hypothetical protein